MRGLLGCAVLVLFIPLGEGQIVTQSATSQEAPLLARIKIKMGEHFLRQPDYTCTQLIERSLRQAPSRRFQLVDTLRLEVALVEGKEMFSWPGASEFEVEDLREIVPMGAIGSGSFALHARSVFLTSSTKFTFIGKAEHDGVQCIRYDYEVPLADSGYLLKVDSVEGVVSYHGSFWVNAETLDLVRLEVYADDIPSHIPLRSADTVMEFAPVSIGEGDFLLPNKAILTMTDLDGNVSRNETRFTACRQYIGESFLSFGEPPPVASEPAPLPPSTTELPGGLRLSLKLETAIDGDLSMVGDPVTAIVRSDARMHRKVIVPKGARARGRLVYLRKISNDVPHWIAAIKFESLEFDNKRAELIAEIEQVRLFSFGDVRAVTKSGFSSTHTAVAPDLEKLPGVGVIYVKDKKMRLQPGTVMIWRTEATTDGE